VRATGGLAVLLVLYSVPGLRLALVILIPSCSIDLALLPAGGMKDPVLYDYLSPGDTATRPPQAHCPAGNSSLLTGRMRRYQRNPR
jgi:hypothetical protein